MHCVLSCNHAKISFYVHLIRRKLNNWLELFLTHSKCFPIYGDPSTDGPKWWHFTSENTITDISNSILDINNAIFWYQELNCWYQESTIQFLISKNGIVDIKNSYPADD